MPLSAMAVQAMMTIQLDALFTITLAMLVISLTSVSLRIYVRKFMLKKIGKDDWAMLAAQITFIATCGLTFSIVGLNQDIKVGSPSPPSLEATLEKRDRLTNAAYCLTMLLAKISLGFFFLNIFDRSFRWCRVTIHFLVVLGTTIGIIYLALNLFSCGAEILSPGEKPDCGIQGAFIGISTCWSILNALQDFTFAGIAIFMLSHSQLPRAAKISCGTLLGLAALGGIFSCMRVVVQLISFDPRLQGLALGRWSNLEAGLCITVASLATLRPLVRSLWARAAEQQRNSRIWLPNRRKSQDTFSVYTQHTLTSIHTGVQPEMSIVGNWEPEEERRKTLMSEKEIVVTKVFELGLVQGGSVSYPASVKFMD